MAEKVQYVRNRFLLIALVLVGLLLLINAYLIVDRVQRINQVDKLEMDLAYADSLTSMLNQEYNEALLNLERMKGENDSLNFEIEKKQEELRAQRDQIEQLILSGNRTRSELDRVKKLIGELMAQRDQYYDEISELRASLVEYQERTKVTEAEKEVLLKNIEEERSYARQLQEEKTEIEQERRLIEREAARLSEKVNRASVLDISNIEITPLRIRRNGTTSPTAFARRTEKLEVCFRILENVIAATGTEHVYLRVISPLGETMAVEALGSGVLVTAENNDEVRYSVAETLIYRNMEQDLCMYWQPEHPFQQGIYTIEVYNKGYRVGNASFKLR